MQFILELLGDGKYHGLDDLQEEAELSKEQIRETVLFLTEYGFSEMNKVNKKVRISKIAKKIFAQLS